MVCWDGVGNKVVDFSGDYFVFLEKTEKFVVMMKRKIILVTGGQRSGKSRYAQELALKLAENPVYLATSRVWDDEFRERVRRHNRTGVRNGQFGRGKKRLVDVTCRGGSWSLIA